MFFCRAFNITRTDEEGIVSSRANLRNEQPCDSSAARSERQRGSVPNGALSCVASSDAASALGARQVR